MRVLVCGGRDYRDRDTVFAVLDTMLKRSNIEVVIEGGASGADLLASEWARTRKIEVLEFPADWETHGRAAGPIRNAQMLEEGRPDIVIAFPGGRGTENMVLLAKEKGVTVMRVGAKA